MSCSAVSSPKFQDSQLSAFSKLYWMFLMGPAAPWEAKLYTLHSENNDLRAFDHLCPLQSLLSCQLLFYDL